MDVVDALNDALLVHLECMQFVDPCIAIRLMMHVCVNGTPVYTNKNSQMRTRQEYAKVLSTEQKAINPMFEYPMYPLSTYVQPPVNTLVTPPR